MALYVCGFEYVLMCGECAWIVEANTGCFSLFLLIFFFPDKDSQDLWLIM